MANLKLIIASFISFIYFRTFLYTDINKVHNICSMNNKNVKKI